jgi:hypothetical protein
LEHYLIRAELGFWQEEVFVSLYSAARLKEQLGYPEQEVVDAYLRAADALATRAEALHGASRFCRQQKRYEEGYQLAKRGLEIPQPSSEALFVEPWIYETGLLDECAVNAYWAGRNRASLDANLKLLGTGKLSAKDTRRVLANARFASDRLPRDPNLGPLGADDFVEQHALASPRPLRSRLARSPRVLLAIVARQNEEELPLYLKCIEALDYPKSSIVLFIQIQDSSDGTERLLREWVDRTGYLYGDIEFNTKDVSPVEPFGDRRRGRTAPYSIRHARELSMLSTLRHRCEFHFVVDVGNFVRACTLRELVSLNLPIVAPFLRSSRADELYANYHADIDGDGYYKDCDQYVWALNRWVRGVLEMPVVNGTYLVRADVLSELVYDDGADRHEYVIFSESARKNSVPQYLDNRQLYGYVVREDERGRRSSIELRRVKELMGGDAGESAPALAFGSPRLTPVASIPALMPQA